MASRRFIVALIGFFLLAMQAYGHAAILGNDLRKSLETAAPGTSLPVIVNFGDKVDLPVRASVNAKERRDEMVHAMRGKAEIVQRPVKDFLRSRGIDKVKSLWIINALAIDADRELIEELAVRPEVEEIRLNATITSPVVVPQQVTGVPEWNIEAVGADRLWGLGLTGQGAVIASLDGGVDSLHPDLQSKWRGWNGTSCDPINNPALLRDWFDPNGEHPGCPYDSVGHGTSVMGVMVGGDAGGSVIGVAPEATWIAAKIFDDAGNANLASIHSAFQWLLDPDGNGDTGDAPDIVNNSWGLTSANSCDNEFQADIQLLKAAGIVVTFSAGNTGPDPSSSISPANYPESIAVGATDLFGAIANFSGRGPSACPSGDSLYPQLSAPGTHIKTTDLTFGGVIPSSYVIADGTSLSAPHLSGVMALLLGQAGFPLLTVPELESALQLSATDLGVEGPDNNFGYGMVNSFAAYKRLTGQPYLALYDPAPPENDLMLNFGSVPVGLGVVRELVIRNSGGGVLSIPVNAFIIPGAPFSVASDTCSGANLPSDTSCRVGVKFSPTGAVDFASTLSISSNDADQSPVPVSLAGTGNLNPLPPQIVVGQVLDFGSVAPGTSVQRILTISNSGDDFLSVGPLDFSNLPPQFSVVADQCTGAVLGKGGTCDVFFSFMPNSVNTFLGPMDIISSDPDESLKTVNLIGVGNNPPGKAILSSPPNGATGVALPVILRWFHPADPDGDQVTDTVRISELAPADAGAGFSINPFQGLGLSPLAGIAIFFSCFPLLILFVRRSRTACLAVLVCGLLLLNSCGGGSDAPPAVAGPNGSFTATNLKSGTTYTWKVVSEDSRGGISESETRSFTTR